MSTSIAIVKQRATSSNNNNHNNRADDLCSNSHTHDYHSKMISTSLGCSAIMTITSSPNDCNSNTNTTNSSSITNDMTTTQPILLDGSATRYIRLKSFYVEHCIYLPAMLGWFVFSAALSYYNKRVFGETHGAFPCPLLLTSVHFFAQWIFSYVVSTLFPVFIGTERITSMTWTEWLGTSVPCGLVTSGDVGLSNLSLVTISMTFYTMVKSSTPIFVLMWAYLFGIERITYNLLFVVFIIAIGEVLTVTGEVDFHPVGFTLCLMASVLSGARWTLVQLKLRSMDPPLKTTIATMRLLAPSMFWSMLIVSLIVERPWIKLGNRPIRHTLFDLFALGMVGATIAILMILCEFWLIMRSNAIVLMIGGVLKEMVTIIVGVSCFGDELNRINVSGCFVVFVGVIYYKISHYSDTKKQHHTTGSVIDTVDGDDDDTNDTSTIQGHNNNGMMMINDEQQEQPTSPIGSSTIRRSRTPRDGIIYTKVMNDSSERGRGISSCNSGSLRTGVVEYRKNSRTSSTSSTLETGESTSELISSTTIQRGGSSSLDSLC